MKQAIKQAIEGGYKLPNLKDETAILLMALAVKEKTLLDPKFWQCLGKAVAHDPNNYELPENWVKIWHRFIDHLADGGTPDEFFEKLLTKQN